MFPAFRAFVRQLPVDLSHLEAPEPGHVNSNLERQLPPEVLEHIFRYLSVFQLKKVRRVCHGWRQIVDGGSPRLLAGMKLKFPSEVILDEDFELGCPPQMGVQCVAFIDVRVISMSSPGKIQPWWEPLAGRLTELRLVDAKICIFEFARMLRAAPNLRTLIITFITFPFYVNTERVIESIDLQLKLQKFSIICQRYDLILPVFGRSCTELKECLFDDSLRRSEERNLVIRFLKTTPSVLETIRIRGSKAIVDALCSLPNFKLKRLCLKEVTAPFENVLQLIRLHPDITSLTLYDCAFWDADLAELGSALPNLRALASSLNMDDTLWKPIFLETMPNLEKLEISNTNQNHPPVNFNDFNHLVLQELCLRNLEISEPRHFRPFCMHVQRLVLTNVRFPSWSHLFDSIPYDTVSELHLNSLEIDETLGHAPELTLVRKFRNLRHLTLYSLDMNCNDLVTIFHLATNLEAVWLDELSHAEDHVVQTLLEKSAGLQKLSIRDCSITDAIVEHIIGHCRALELLDIEQNQLTKGALKRLAACGWFELRSRIECVAEDW